MSATASTSRGLVSCLAVAFLLVAGASSASAGSVIYEYTGNPFTTGGLAGSRVAGTIELASALPDNMTLQFVSVPVFEFTASTITIDNNTTPLVQASFQFATDAVGEISEWSISLRAASGFNDCFVAGMPFGECLFTQNNAAGSAFDQATLTAGAGQVLGNSQNNPGSWTLVPEPATSSLMLLGLAALAYPRRA